MSRKPKDDSYVIKGENKRAWQLRRLSELAHDRRTRGMSGLGLQLWYELKEEAMANNDRLAKLHLLPCVVCHLMGVEQASPTEAHHMHHLPNGYKFKVGMRRADHEHTIPLCRNLHHWNGVHNKGDWCLSTFEAHVGKTEPELWEITNEMLEEL